MTSAVARKASAKTKMSADGKDDRRLPPDAYAFDDDVTPEAVDEMRRRASKIMDAEKWEVVDGVGPFRSK